MKKTLILGLVFAVAAGCLFAPATAKKKKKKPAAPAAVDVNYYLHRNTCGEDGDQTTLSIVDGADDGNGCGSVESGAITEIYESTGQTPPAVGPVSSGPDSVTWTATDGVPFVLDGSKEIKGTIVVNDFCCGEPVGSSAGQARMDIAITGTTADASAKIGDASVTYTLTPNQYQYTVEFSIKPDAALDKASFTSLELTTTLRGVSALHGFYELDDPASLITVPTFQ